jgi:hypothetical protein
MRGMYSLMIDSRTSTPSSESSMLVTEPTVKP